MSDRWTDRLSDFIDGELGPEAERALQAHLAQCAECARTADELRRVVASLGSLPDTPPEIDLWPGIEHRLTSRTVAASATPVISLEQRRRRFSFTLPQLAAAGIAVVALSSMTVWLVLSHGANPAAPAAAVATAQPTTSPAAPASRPASPATGENNPAAGVPGAVPQARSQQLAASTTPAGSPRAAQAREGESGRVRSGAAFASARTRRTESAADRQYDAAVADLQKIMRQHRSQLQPETIKAVEKSLNDIDKAIADARRALARDPADPYLNDHLAESMRLKLELLRQTAALVQS